MLFTLIGVLDVVHSELIVEVGLAGVSSRAGGSGAGVKVRIEVSVLLLWLPGGRSSSTRSYLFSLLSHSSLSSKLSFRPSIKLLSKFVSHIS